VRPRPRPRPGKQFENLLALQKRLREPGGCPWDREQTSRSLRTFLLEETYEVLDALDSGDMHEFASELGDLLLQIVFHSLLAQEAGLFTIEDVIEGVHSKMVRRHPHVFGNVKAVTSSEVLKNWAQLKLQERAKCAPAGKRTEAESLLDAVPRNLPALSEALQLTRRAAGIGFDWDRTAAVFAKLAEESAELIAALHKESPTSAERASSRPHTSNAAVEEEAGDVLFAAANVVRFLGLDPELVLRSANRKFAVRFRFMERAAARQGTPLANVTRDKMEQLWNESKRQPPPRAR
jgi:tetrapyrrole methylase family protein/MazG family protein